MIINHNIAALNTHRQLGINNNAASANLEKLSSGLKINRAGDDAAGLAISEKMRGQIRGLDMAAKNAQDGISLIQTAEGALNETHSILQRMRELAVQAANDTNSDSDRSEIQKELNQLTSEINRISNTTEFNTKKLLNGGVEDVSVKTIITGKAGAAVAGIPGEFAFNFADFGTLHSNNIVSIGDKDYQFEAASPSGGIDNFSNADELVALIEADDQYTAVNSGGIITLTQKTATDDKTGPTILDHSGAPVTVTTLTDGVTTKDGEFPVAGKFEFTLDLTKLKEGQKLRVGNWEFTFEAAAGATGNGFSSIDQLIAKITEGTEFEAEKTADGAIALTQAPGQESNAVPKVSIVNSEGGFKAVFQIGANENQSMTLEIGDMRASALGIVGTGTGFTADQKVTVGTGTIATESALDVSSHENASAAITKFQSAIDQVSGERSKLGAVQNRLEHTINNLGTSSENLTAAESRIRDIDMAAEMMNFTKNNILTQAAQAMLAQSNQMPEGVLQLLR